MEIVINPPDAVLTILRGLDKAGHDAYIVGGCVRDSILGREPHDWDITTEALPSQVREVFADSKDIVIVPTGEVFGTLTLVSSGMPIEVTTYRSDGKYSDGRHPDNVTFTTSLRDDLMRRDFTINALAYKIGSTKVIDYFGGLTDLLNDKVLRAVGNAEERFIEDPLRMLRAIRFAAQLGFKIATETHRKIYLHARKIDNIAPERIQAELNKILLSDYPGHLSHGATLLYKYLPELMGAFGTNHNNPHHVYDIGMHTMEVIKNCPNNLITRLAALLHDMGKLETRTVGAGGICHYYGHAEKSAEIAERFLTSLKYSTNIRTKVIELVKSHDVELVPTKRWVRRYLSNIEDEQFLRLVDLRRADVIAQNPELLGPRLELIKNVLIVHDEIIAEKDCLSIKDLAINGTDLMELGMMPGPVIGEMLKFLLQAVIDDPSRNTKEELTKIVRSTQGGEV